MSFSEIGEKGEGDGHTPVPLSSKEKLRLCERVRRIDLDSAPRSFFLYEKSVLRESDSLRGRKPEVCTDSTTPFPPLKKPLKITGSKGI